MEGEKIDFKRLVDFIQANRHKEGIALLLGARAGGFFRSQVFYDTMRAFGGPSFGELSRVKQFGKCYEILMGGKLFKGDGIDTILIAALEDVETIDVDRDLAKLVKQEVFDVLISTNVDNLLEQALEGEGLKELHHFDVFSPKVDIPLRSDRKFLHRIIKVAGELRTRDYSYAMTPEMRIRSTQQLEEMLQTELARNIVAVGLDPVWDKDILQALPAQGRTLWYIGEEEPDKYPLLREIHKTRSCEFLVGINGSYSHAMKELAELLLEKTSSAMTPIESTQQNDIALRENRALIEGIRGLGSIPVISPPLEKALPPTQTAVEIFISYVPEDEALFRQLTSHLSTLRNQNIINIWHHHRIIAGEYRKNEIDRHLNSASVILLLVSADFNASEDYMHGVELERAIELHKGQKARVIPVILRPVDWQGTPFEGLESLPSSGQPVTQWKDTDSAFLDIVNGVKNVIKSLKPGL